MTQAPGELGIDLTSGEFFARDPYPAFAWMRRGLESMPVTFTPTDRRGPRPESERTRPPSSLTPADAPGRAG